jgi:protein-tyrosine phosphatase
MAQATDLSKSLLIDSAGTHAYHVGSAPDGRAQQAANGRGYDLSNLIGRQVADSDFEQFDYILAMDQDNLDNLNRRCPDVYRDKLSLLLAHSAKFRGQEVPDPYYGGSRGFDHVLDMVEDAAQGLLEEIRRRQA